MTESLSANELILREERDFIQRLRFDHIADTESNLSFIKSKVKNCAKEGVEVGGFVLVCLKSGKYKSRLK